MKIPIRVSLYPCLTEMEQNKMQEQDETAVKTEAWLAYVTNVWSRTVVQPFLIAAMAVALAAGPLVVMQTVTPDIPWRSFIFVFFLIALEGVYTAVWLARPNQRSLNKAAYRAAEFVVIALIMRLLAWAFIGDWPDLVAWKTYLFEPLTFFGDVFFLVTLVFVFAIWQSAIHTGSIFAALALDTAEAAYYADAFGKGKLENRPIVTNRSRLIDAFLQRWLWGGFVSIICAALSTFDLSGQSGTWSPLAMTRLGMPSAMLLALLVYFGAGFLLLSQGRLAALNARWLINGVTKMGRVERSWYRYSMRLLVAVGFIAALLPLGSTIGLSRIVGAIVGWLTAVVAFIWLLFMALLAWLLPSQAPDTTIDPAAPLPTAVPAAPPSAPPTEAGETAAMIFSSAFWAVAIVITVIAVAFFLRERGYRLDGQGIRQLWRIFTNWMANFWRGLSSHAAELRQAAQMRRRAKSRESEARKPSPWRFIRLNALSPREQLRYFYLSTVRRAGERGVEREQSETPLEYARDLKENWPDAEMDVESLTDAFLKARYSPKPVDKQEVNPIKRHWKRLRAALRTPQMPGAEDKTLEK
ncbi:MAG: DUF4129 domain-containing protein [Chloroflexi bacterium]|nr:DUF4129 domain-containing protein [Chloroflexota bacterium]